MAQTVRSGFALAALAAALAPACFSQNPVKDGTCVQPQNADHGLRVAGSWNSGEMAVLPDSHGPWRANAEDNGAAPENTRIERLLLLLEPSAEQQSALDARLKAQQTPGACGFHQWMTVGAFADAFANSAADVQQVTDWLTSRGFAVTAIPAGRGWIEFSGTVAQVEQAFGADVRRLAGRGGEQFALAGPIFVPAALRPMVHGLVSLDGARSAAAITAVEPVQSSLAQLRADAEGNSMAITPDAASRLLHSTTNKLNGAGAGIAIITRGSVAAADVGAFRQRFGLPASPIQSLGTGASALTDSAQATLAAEWAGVAAPGAQIAVDAAASTAATDGVDLALADAVDRAAASTIVVGYSGCEPALSETHRAFYSAVYRQAAAEGISVIVAAGDSGAAGCHQAGSASEVSSGYAVNALAATEWNTAVSSAELAGDGAMSAWSEGTFAAGGGMSAAAARPQWQPITAEVSGEGRLLPDVAVAMSASGSRGVAFCYGGSGGCALMQAGGSGAAAAVFGGVSAVLAQKYGLQGNLAPGLYTVSGAGAFEDVRAGSAKLSCTAGTPGCGADGTLGYDAGDGYDLASGLGVPNVDALVKAWANLQNAGTTASQVTLTLSPQQANNTYNPSAQITLTASVSGSGAIPTGTVTFKNGSTTLGSAASLDSTGTAKLAITGGWGTGGNNIVAAYSGDSSYAASTSQVVVVTGQPSSTSMTLTPSTTTPAAGSSMTVTMAMSFGTPPAGAVAPTGKVTLNVDGAANTTATLQTVGSGTGATLSLSAPTASGSHTLQAIYNGDTNYQASVSTPVTITTSKGATVTTLTASPTTLSPTVPETLTASVAPLNATAGTTYTLTGTVSFYDGTTLLGSATLASNTATLSNVTLSTATTHQLTAMYSGDTNWATSTSNPVTLTPSLLSDTVTLTASPAVAAPGQVITFVATVMPAVAPAATAEQNPTGNVVFYLGTKVLGTVAVTAGPNNTAVAQLISATLPAGTDAVTAYYVGDLYYAAATSNAVNVTVQDFSIAPSSTNSPTNLNIVKGQSGTASFVVTGLGGFNGQIQVVCAVPSQDDMDCTPSPQQMTPTGTVTFTVKTYVTGGPSAAARPVLPWAGAAGGTALAGLFVLIAPLGKRARWLTERTKRSVGMLLLLAGVGLAGVGCSSVSGSGSSAANSGTPLGVATLKITATAYVDNTVVSHSLDLTVNVLPPQ